MASRRQADAGHQNGPSLAAAERPSLADHAYEELRRNILDGRIPMGKRLREPELSRQLGMSRAPLREALRRLAEEGLVEYRPHRGMYVRPISADDIVDLYNARLAIESQAARLVIRRGVSTAPLRKLVEELENEARHGDARVVTARGSDFHILLCGISGNRVISDFAASVAARLQVAVAIHDALVDNPLELAHSHIDILEAIEAGDEAASVKALTDHVTSGIGEVVRALGGDPALLLPPAIFDCCGAQRGGQPRQLSARSRCPCGS